MNLGRFAERAPFPIMRVSRDGIVEWANRASRPLLEAWDSGIGKPVPTSDAARIGLVAARGTDTEIDLQIDGRAWTLRMCPDAGGARVLVYAHDRSRTAEAEKLLVVADRAPALCPDPIMRISADGLLTWANSAARPIIDRWGVSTGNPLPPDWVAATKRVLAENAPHEEVLEYKGAAWQIRLVPDVDGASVYAFARDASRPTPETEELQRENFVANMGHELRTPLNAVIGYAELLKDDMADRSLLEPIADLDKIRSSAVRLRTMIDRMVDLAKLQAGRIALRPQTFYVSDLVDDVLAHVSSAADASGLEIYASIDVEPEEMRVDPDRLRQVLKNLLDNAIKFTEEGEIHLEVKDAKGADGTRAVVFRITDTGIGIDANQLSRLFQPYSQGDASATRKYGGSGLGLSITRMLCRLMGGDVTVRSELGHGSTFTVMLPRIPRPE